MTPWKAGVEEHEFANDEDVGTKNPSASGGRNQAGKIVIERIE
jgi:hypothetical protein